MNIRSVRLISVLFCFAAGSVHSIEFLSARGAGLGNSIILSQPTASALVNLPVMPVRQSAWRLESGYNRLFELSDFDQLFVAAAGRWRSFVGAIGISQFGQSDIYSEKLLKTSLALHSRMFALGVSLSGQMVEIGNGYGGLRAAALGLSAGFNSRRIFAALSVDDINSPRLHRTSLPIKPRYAAHFEFVGKQSFSLTGRLQVQPQQRPQFGIGQRIELSHRAAFFWGLQNAPLLYGGGVELDFRRLRFTYATAVHPALGLTHTLALSFGKRLSDRSRKEKFE